MRSLFSPLVFLLAAVPLVAGAGCSFDTSALDDRPPCETDDDCPQGTCLGGSCWAEPVLTTDTGNDVGQDIGGDPADSGDTGGGGGGDVVETCHPAQLRCDGNDVWACDDDGTTWNRMEVCGEDHTCTEGSCIPNTCEQGETSCAGEQLLACSSDGVFELSADCANSQAWCSSVGEPHCEPRICTPDHLRCSDSGRGLEVCNARGNGWSTSDTCDVGETCEFGECVPLECMPGDQACVSTGVYSTCNPTGEDRDSTNCPSGTYCSEVDDRTISCVPQSCIPHERRCLTGQESYERCDELGSGFEAPVDCDSDEYCLTGICTAQACSPNTSRCGGLHELRVCDDRGSREVLTPCTAGTACVQDGESATCVPTICSPGTKRCGGDLRSEICNDSGTAWVVHEVCGEASICKVDRCVDIICETDAFECTSASNWRRCVDMGTAWSTGTCSSSQACDPALNRCETKVCEPNLRTCTGNALYECNALGTENSLRETCDDFCIGGECVASECGDGTITPDEECDDGNTTNGDGCDSNCKIELCDSDEIQGPDGHCYHVSSTNRSWTQAQTYCRRRTGNSDLVTIRNATQNQWLVSGLGITSNHWIGLNDRQYNSDEGKYKWSRGDVRLGGTDYTNWGPGEPNNGGTGIGANEDCVEILPSGLWNDKGCSTSQRAICERF